MLGKRCHRGVLDEFESQLRKFRGLLIRCHRAEKQSPRTSSPSVFTSKPIESARKACLPGDVPDAPFVRVPCGRDGRQAGAEELEWLTAHSRSPECLYPGNTGWSCQAEVGVG